MSLLIVCPSRGRPAKLGRLLDRLDETCTVDWTLAAGLDTDDPAKTDYMRLLRPGPRGAQARDHTNVLIAARRPLGGWINTLWQMFAHSGITHVAFLGDDHLPAARGWDADLIAAVDDCPAGVGIAYGDDLLQGEGLPTAPVMSASIPRALGWLALPGLAHYYLDNAWDDIGRACECLRYVPEVTVEHLHHAAGKAPMDSTYADAWADGRRMNEDREAFLGWRQMGLPADATAVRALIG